MNTSRFIILCAVAVIIVGASPTFAAPCESVESAGASTTYQKVDALLSEHIVATRLQAIGLSSQQAHAHVSRSSTNNNWGNWPRKPDLIQTGGTIQHDKNLGPLDCMWYQLTTFCTNVYRLIFCWGDLK